MKGEAFGSSSASPAGHADRIAADSGGDRSSVANVCIGSRQLTGKSRSVSIRMKLESLFIRRMVRCILCHDVIEAWTLCEWHHIHERQLGGPNSPDNVGPVHRDPCHRKATARFARDRAHIERLRLKAAGKVSKGPIINSRGFDRTKRRRLDGTVVDRPAPKPT